MKLLSEKDQGMLYEVMDHYEFRVDRRDLGMVIRWIRSRDTLLDLTEMERDLKSTGWVKTQEETTRVFSDTKEESSHLTNLGWEPYDSERICFFKDSNCLYLSRTQTMWLAYV